MFARELGRLDVEPVVAAFARAERVDQDFRYTEPYRLRRSKHRRKACVGRAWQVGGQPLDSVGADVVQEEIDTGARLGVAVEQDALAVGRPGPDADGAVLRADPLHVSRGDVDEGKLGEDAVVG